MDTFFLSFVVIGLAAFSMAVGVLVRGSELNGTCATLDGANYASIACEFCPTRNGQRAGVPRHCPRRELLERSADLSGIHKECR